MTTPAKEWKTPSFTELTPDALEPFLDGIEIRRLLDKYGADIPAIIAMVVDKSRGGIVDQRRLETLDNFRAGLRPTLTAATVAPRPTKAAFLERGLDAMRKKGKLTARHVKIADLRQSGMTVGEIAEELHISERTAARYLGQVRRAAASADFRKEQAREAVALALTGRKGIDGRQRYWTAKDIGDALGMGTRTVERAKAEAVCSEAGQ